MAEYLRLVELLLVILFVFGLLFSFIAIIARFLKGSRGVWTAWAVYVALLTGGCVYRLSGLAGGAPNSVPRMFYYCAVALAGVGVPLAVAAACTNELASRRPAMRVQWQLVLSWLAAMSAAPAGVLLIFVVDRIAL